MAGVTDPLYLWIEPGRPDIDEGMRARVADPVWFLARQWQLGEQRGEDASMRSAAFRLTAHSKLLRFMKPGVRAVYWPLLTVSKVTYGLKTRL